MFALEAYANSPQTPPPGGGLWDFLLMMAVIFSIFYFILIRPERKKRQQHEERVNSLKKGDRIITSGGIFGKIVGMKDKEGAAVIQIAENVKIEILKSSISTILDEDKGKK